MSKDGKGNGLTLTCEEMQPIYIGDDIIVTVTQIDRNRVRLCIKAPLSVEILREVLYRQKLNRKKGTDHAAHAPAQEDVHPAHGALRPLLPSGRTVQGAPDEKVPIPPPGQ